MAPVVITGNYLIHCLLAEHVVCQAFAFLRNFLSKRFGGEVAFLPRALFLENENIRLILLSFEIVTESDETSRAPCVTSRI